MRELAKEELPATEEKDERMESSMRQMLIPKDPQDEKNAILEIRAGTGGDEASLFAGDLANVFAILRKERMENSITLSERKER